MLAINPSDVIAVLKACKLEIIVAIVALLLAVIVTIAVHKLAKPGRKLIRSEAWIAFLLVAVIIVNVVIIGPMNTMASLALDSGQISEESIEESEEICLSIAEEGMVLLKNENGSLPLEKGTKLNVFGWSSTNPVYGGTGSGSVSDAYEKIDIITSLQDAGFEVNEELVNFYTSYADTRPSVGMMGQDWTVTEPSILDYEAAGILESAKEYSDVAVVVIARSGGEGADLPTSYDGESTYTEGGGPFGGSGVRYSSNEDDLDASKTYLELTNREKALLDRVTDDYDQVIVVINSANTMELGFLDEYDSIVGAIWTAGAGQTGFEALRDSNAGSTIELAIVTPVVELLFRTVALDGLDQITQSGLGADDGSLLTAGSGLDHLDELQERGGAVAASGRVKVLTTKLSLGSIHPQSVDVTKNLLRKGIRHIGDHLIEINATGQNTIQLLVNTHIVHTSRNGSLSHARQTLAPNRLSAISTNSNGIQIAILHSEHGLVALGHIAEVNKAVEEVRVSQAIDNSAVKNLLNQSKHALALTVADLAVVELSGTTIQLNQSIAESLLRLADRILLNIAVISINSSADNFIHIHINYSSLLGLRQITPP